MERGIYVSSFHIITPFLTNSPPPQISNVDPYCQTCWKKELKLLEGIEGKHKAVGSKKKTQGGKVTFTLTQPSRQLHTFTLPTPLTTTRGRQRILTFRQRKKRFVFIVTLSPSLTFTLTTTRGRQIRPRGREKRRVNVGVPTT